MFKSKSFDLINEDELKKRDKLYDPKRSRWMNFIVIPVLIGFMLLLILANVDFTGTAYLTNTTTTMVTEATTLPTTRMTSLEFDRNKAYESSQLDIYSNDHAADETMGRAGLVCQADDNDSCKISCSGSVKNVKSKLETQYRKCAAGTLEVIFHYCEFQGRAMKEDFLSGYFYIHSLTISNCDLNYIYPQAFNQYSVSNYLKTLIFEKTQFGTLDDVRFLGLQVITYFRLENNEPDNLNFLGLSFLKPIAATLNETKLVQHTTRSTKYTPISWFTGAYFQKLLRVDLSNNYFPDTLANRTFLTLTEVQELILANCQIRSMESGTFDAIIKTLHYLDLSNNQLTTLSGDFLSNSGSNFKMELSANSWECTCDNSELIKFIKNSAIDFGEEPTCTSPDDMHGLSLKHVSFECGDTIPTTTPASNSTTTPQDTSAPTNEPQDTSTSSTGPGSTTPQDTPTPITTTNEPQDTSTSSKGPITTTPQDTATSLTDSNEPQDTSTNSKNPETTTKSSNTTNSNTDSDTSANLDPDDTTGTTITTDVGSTTSDNTIGLPTITTEITPANPITIVCKDYTKYEVFNQTIRNYDALFGVYSESSTSVVLHILNDMSKIRLIYFIPKLYFNSQYSKTDTNSSAKVSSRLCERVVTTTIIHIQGLEQNQTYVFCLVPHDETSISPFNCRSHKLMDQSPTDTRESWLHIKDIAWMMSAVAIGIVVCVIFGSCFIYWLLRRRPTWLCGSKRLIKMGCKPHEMLLLPKDDRITVENKFLSRLANMRPSISDVLEPEHYSAVDSYDYMQFYKNLEISKLNPTELLSEYLPPFDRAPTIPSSCSSTSRPTSTQSTICTDDQMQLCNMADLDDVYQSLNHYEHIC